MVIELPPPGSNDVDDHMAMSRRFIGHAKDELRKGDRLQASESFGAPPPTRSRQLPFSGGGSTPNTKIFNASPSR